MIVTYSRNHPFREVCKYFAKRTGNIYLPRGTKSIDKLWQIAKKLGQSYVLIFSPYEFRVLSCDEFGWDWDFIFKTHGYYIFDEFEGELFSFDFSWLPDEGDILVKFDKNIDFIVDSKLVFRIISQVDYPFYAEFDIYPELTPELKMKGDRALVWADEKIKVAAKDDVAFRAATNSLKRMIHMINNVRGVLNAV